MAVGSLLGAAPAVSTWSMVTLICIPRPAAVSGDNLGHLAPPVRPGTRPARLDVVVGATALLHDQRGTDLGRPAQGTAVMLLLGAVPAVIRLSTMTLIYIPRPAAVFGDYMRSTWPHRCVLERGRFGLR